MRGDPRARRERQLDARDVRRSLERRASRARPPSRRTARVLRRRRLGPVRPALARSRSTTRAIEVVAAEAVSPPVASTSEDASRELQDRDVERAAAEVVDRDQRFVLLVEPVGERRRGRLVDEAQHVEAGEPAGVAGRLALAVVEVGRAP